MKRRSLIILLLALTFLISTNAYLLWQNNRYRQQVRTLILQNDSILSVNLELQQGTINTLKSTVHAMDKH